MSRTSVFDTSTVKGMFDRNIITSKRASSELRKHNIDACFVDDYPPSAPTKACTNNVIMKDIAKINRRLASSKVNKFLKEARDLPVSLQETYLERAWKEIPSKFKRKNWADEVTGSQTDCSLISLAKERDAPLYSDDTALLEQCKQEYLDKFCKSLTL